ncbi:reticulocyte-binding protein 2 homolog a-like, partial [Belonocnema kinseyi]|uniref:reticulocyte-binding protein 2 homolog a-like n=1 Tax=Belonocnema kinseyi TaxID=2817044 RepID=UPI00143CCE83
MKLVVAALLFTSAVIIQLSLAFPDSRSGLDDPFSDNRLAIDPARIRADKTPTIRTKPGSSLDPDFVPSDDGRATDPPQAKIIAPNTEENELATTFDKDTSPLTREIIKPKTEKEDPDKNQEGDQKKKEKEDSEKNQEADQKNEEKKTRRKAKKLIKRKKKNRTRRKTKKLNQRKKEKRNWIKAKKLNKITNQILIQNNVLSRIRPANKLDNFHVLHHLMISEHLEQITRNNSYIKDYSKDTAFIIPVAIRSKMVKVKQQPFINKIIPEGADNEKLIDDESSPVRDNKDNVHGLLKPHAEIIDPFEVNSIIPEKFQRQLSLAFPDSRSGPDDARSDNRLAIDPAQIGADKTPTIKTKPGTSSDPDFVPSDDRRTTDPSQAKIIAPNTEENELAGTFDKDTSTLTREMIKPVSCSSSDLGAQKYLVRGKRDVEENAAEKPKKDKEAKKKEKRERKKKEKAERKKRKLIRRERRKRQRRKNKKPKETKKEKKTRIKTKKLINRKKKKRKWRKNMKLIKRKLKKTKRRKTKKLINRKKKKRTRIKTKKLNRKKRKRMRRKNMKLIKRKMKNRKRRKAKKLIKRKKKKRKQRKTKKIIKRKKDAKINQESDPLMKIKVKQQPFINKILPEGAGNEKLIEDEGSAVWDNKDNMMERPQIQLKLDLIKQKLKRLNQVPVQIQVLFPVRMYQPQIRPESEPIKHQVKVLNQLPVQIQRLFLQMMDRRQIQLKSELVNHQLKSLNRVSVQIKMLFPLMMNRLPIQLKSELVKHLIKRLNQKDEDMKKEAEQKKKIEADQKKKRKTE